MRLRTKILLFYLPLALVSVGVMTQIARRGVRHIVEQGVARRGLSVATGAAQDMALLAGLRQESEARLLPLLQAIQVQTQALYAAALAQDGRVLAHTNVGERGKVYGDSLTVGGLRSAVPRFSRARSAEDQPVMDIAVPVWESSPEPLSGEAFLLTGREEREEQLRLGTLRLGLPLREELEIGARISAQIFWIISVGCCLILIVILIFTGRVLRPIRLLAEATEQLGRGELGQQVPIGTGDEIGDLARSFNRMSVDLARTTVSKDFLDSILANMQEALLVATADGRVRAANRSAQNLLGYAETDLQERCIVELFALEALDDGTATLESLVRQQASRNLGGRAIACSGVRVPVLVSISTFADPQNCTAGYIVTARDITAWQQAEEARLEAEQRLEEQKALSIRSDRLRSLGEMAAGIAHELNQPLVGVRGQAEHLLIGLERNWELTQEKLRQRLERIIEQADRMVHIIQHVRLFAREAGKPESALVQVNDVVGAALELLGVQSRAHGMTLDSHLEEGLPAVRANPYSLEEAVLNLINNARDAVEERFAGREMADQRRVLVRTCQIDEGGLGRVCIAVEDNGIGIPAAILDRVFDSFFTTKAPDKGTGLGLAISKSIVEEFGGQIRIQTAPEQGTTVTILLPSAAPATPP